MGQAKPRVLSPEVPTGVEEVGGNWIEEIKHPLTTDSVPRSFRPVHKPIKHYSPTPPPPMDDRVTQVGLGENPKGWITKID